MCRSRRELSNAYLLAKFGFDTAENEQLFAKRCGNYPTTYPTTYPTALRYAKFQFFCGDAVAAKKPAPDVYNLAAETMGLEKSECVVRSAS